MPFKKTKTEISKISSPKKEDIIKLRHINNKYKRQQLRLLIWIGACIIILIGLVIYAAFRVGGIQNLIQGDGNVITNTVNNVGSAITNPTDTPTPTPTIFTVDITARPKDQKYIENDQNTLVISKFGSPYNVKVRKDTYILFVNNTGKLLGLQFSDKRQYRFEVGEEKNISFMQSGSVTFTDVIDSKFNPINGTIVVE